MTIHRLHQDDSARAAVCGISRWQTPLALASGDRLASWQLAYRWQGKAGAPVVLVLGGISADRFAWRADGSGWWQGLFDHGLDLARFRVLTLDYLGGVGESSPAPGPLAVADQALAIALLLERLNVTRLDAVIGASFGAMVALELARHSPELVERLVLIAGAHRSHRLGAAWRGLQRQVLALGEQAGDPALGVALARALAMCSYRCAREFDERFAETPQAALDYVLSRGQRFAERHDGQVLSRLGQAIDEHRLDPHRIHCPCLVLGLDSDQLVPPWLLAELAEQLPRCRGLEIWPSKYGHDGFIKETRAFGPVLSSFLIGEKDHGQQPDHLRRASGH
ncbi:alpha/beta fold hydrolase [Gallaecimonas sp. GXIMD4217]|uniref:alpha/beta fold hydrolase n=1 Tax=Gallaecimonas sp. GXIMD4217 TaxID=3131927 RepID=UPI00311B0D08